MLLVVGPWAVHCGTTHAVIAHRAYHVDTQLWAACIIVQVACLINHHDVATLVCCDSNRVAFVCLEIPYTIFIFVKLGFLACAANRTLS